VTRNIHGIPAFGTVDLIEASLEKPGTATWRWTRIDSTTCTLPLQDRGLREDVEEPLVRPPPDVYLHAVREDPKKKGMLYAGTERGVMLSRDDGALGAAQAEPAAGRRHDLVVKGDDLVLGTHGRSIWILDDLRRSARCRRT